MAAEEKDLLTASSDEANLMSKREDKESCGAQSQCKGPGWKRYVVAWLSCIGLFLVLAMRCEIGLAIIKMTRKQEKTIEEDDLVANKTNEIVTHKIFVQEISWSSKEIGIIEASFFIGYMLSSLPGGYLSTRYPANFVFGMAALMTFSLNLLVPSAAHIGSGFEATVVVRILQGVAEGCLYPALHALWRHWAPIVERSRLVTISFFGIALGPIIGLPLTGYITSTVGWPYSFYVYGIAGCFWCAFWMIIVAETPSQDTRISPIEQQYIMKNSCEKLHDISIPWGSIFTSLPVYAIIIANMGRNWSFQFSMTCLPEYIEAVFKERSLTTGWLLSMPFIVMAVLTPVGGQLADCVRTKYLSTTMTRKLFNTIGFGTIAITSIFVAFSKSEVVSTLMLTIGLGTTGLGMSGYGVNHLDIAPRYAGVLMGLSNGLGTLSGAISPILVMSITKHKSQQEWMLVFLIAASVHFFTVAFYLIFSSGEEQAWSKQDDYEAEIIPRTAADNIVEATTYGATNDVIVDKKVE